MAADPNSQAFVDAFGTDLVVRGVPARAIIRDDIQVTEFGTLRISSNAPIMVMAFAEAEAIGVAIDDTVELNGSEYLVKEPQPDSMVPDPSFPRMITFRLVEVD